MIGIRRPTKWEIAIRMKFEHMTSKRNKTHIFPLTSMAVYDRTPDGIVHHEYPPPPSSRAYGAVRQSHSTEIMLLPSLLPPHSAASSSASLSWFMAYVRPSTIDLRGINERFTKSVPVPPFPCRHNIRTTTSEVDAPDDDARVMPVVSPQDARSRDVVGPSPRGDDVVVGSLLARRRVG